MLFEIRLQPLCVGRPTAAQDGARERASALALVGAAFPGPRAPHSPTLSIFACAPDTVTIGTMMSAGASRPTTLAPDAGTGMAPTSPGLHSSASRWSQLRRKVRAKCETGACARMRGGGARTARGARRGARSVSTSNRSARGSGSRGCCSGAATGARASHSGTGPEPWRLASIPTSRKST